jgi:hypothetical protein
MRGQQLCGLLSEDTGAERVDLDSAFSLLVQAIEPDQYEHVYGTTTAKAAWSALKAFYAS